MTSNVRAVFAQILGVPLEIGCYLSRWLNEGVLSAQNGIENGSSKSGATSVGATSVGGWEFLVLRMGLKMDPRKSGATSVVGLGKMEFVSTGI
jgi:hypothetical protein